MNESEYLQLRELAWRRSLTAEEKTSLQGYLLVHPEAQQDWEEESVLNQLLVGLPNAPLSSNFTARVLQEIDLEELRAQHQRRSGSWLDRFRLWVPRFALAALVMTLGALGYREYEIFSLREKAKYLDRLVSAASSVPDAKIWEDFDAIARMGHGQPVSAAKDEILWAALSSGAPAE